MSGSVFQVQPGAAQQITGAVLTHGATVWNRDEANSLWVSSDRYCAPDLGLQLPAQASCNWTGKQLFACVDVGVTTPIDLQISNDVQNVSDPVGIAEAIALIGVPNVFLADILLDNVTGTPGQVISLNNVSRYATIEMVLSNAAAGQRDVVTIFWYSSAARTHITSADNYTLGANSVQIEQCIWEIPVRGAVADIWVRSQSQGNVLITVTATNRTSQNIRQVITTVLPRSFSLVNTNVVNGAAYLLTTNDGLGNYSNLNGECQAYFVQSDATPGTLFFQYVAYDGTLQNGFVETQALQTPGPVSFEHPNIPVSWHWLAGGTQANHSVFLNIVAGAGQT